MFPLLAELGYEARRGAESTHVRNFIHEAERPSRNRGGAFGCYRVAKEVLELCAEEALKKKGSKSGHLRDYRFPERKTMAMALKGLVDESELDPKNVLGGSF